MGLGTFLIWLSLMKYLQYSNSYYILAGTMISAGWVILISFVSILPILIGTSYFCMGIFGHMSWRFCSLSESVIMLWSVLLGDEVQNIYHNLLPVHAIGAFVFCYVWTFFSNNFIMPFFLAITEDGYIL